MATVSPFVLTILTFGAGVTAVAGAYSIITDLFLRDRRRVGGRGSDEFRKRQRERGRKSQLYKDPGQLAAQASAGDAAPGIRQRFVAMVEQSGLDVTPERLLTISATAGLSLGALGGLARQGAIVAAVMGLVGAVVPPLYVQKKRKERAEKLLSQ